MADEAKKPETSYEKLKALRKGTKHFESFEFPGAPEVTISIRVCAQAEITAALSKGRKDADAEIYNPTTVDYSEYQEREILYSAVLDSEGKKRFFPSAEAVGDETVDVRTILIEKYNEVQEEFSPVQDIQTEEEFTTALSEVKKNSQIGKSLSSFTTRKLLVFLIANPHILQKVNGTTSTPSNPSEETLKKKPTSESENAQSETPKPENPQTVETEKS